MPKCMMIDPSSFTLSCHSLVPRLRGLGARPRYGFGHIPGSEAWELDLGMALPTFPGSEARELALGMGLATFPGSEAWELDLGMALAVRLTW